MATTPAKTDYIEFEGLPHLHMAAEDWEEVAAGIDSWLSECSSPSRRRRRPRTRCD